MCVSWVTVNVTVSRCGMRCRALMAGSCVLRALRGSRCYSMAAANKLSAGEVSQRRSELYDMEKERQLSLYPRTEKIEVKFVGKTDPGAVFVMNKGLSTPFNCAMHLSEWYCKKSVLALVDGELWDMYKPLTKSCTVQFLTLKDEDPEAVNKAYWRSCAAILGHVLEQAFKDDYMVTLVRAPEIPVISGAFCYDVVLDKRLDDWNPTKENLHSFTKDALKLLSKDLPFECLEMEEKVAREIFQYNPYKLLMLEEKAAQHPQGKVTVHRFGEFVDLSEGPHIPRTGFCFQYEVTAQHPLSTISSEYVRRFQGVSLPRHLMAHHTVWNKLRLRAQKPVSETPFHEPEPEAAG